MLYLTPGSLSYLAQFILTLAITFFLARLAHRLRTQKREWLTTALLAGSFTGWTLFSLLAFLEVSLDPSLRLLPLCWQSPVVALDLVFLLQFVYRFPVELRPRVWESRLVLGLSLWHFLREFAYAIERLTLLTDWNVQYRIGNLDQVLVLEFLWVFVVALRQTVRASNHTRGAFIVRRETKGSAVLTRLGSTASFAMNALIFPRGRGARATRDFAIVFLFFFLLSRLHLARAFDGIPNELREIGVSLFALFALFAFALFYLNALPETTTLMTKLVGIALATMLAILGAAGWLIFPHQLETATVDAPFRQKQTLRFAPNGRGGYDVRAIPFAFETEWGTRLARGAEGEQQRAISLPFAFPFYNQDYDTAYVVDNGMVGLGNPVDWKDIFYYYGPSPAILPLYLDLLPWETTNVQVFANNTTERLTLTWDRVPGVNLQNAFTFQLTLYPDGAFDITHRDIAMRAADLYDTTNPSGIIGAVPGAGRPVQQINLATDLSYSGLAGAGVVDNLYLRLREQIHQPLEPLAYLLLASALLIILGFPLFLRRNFVQPLDALLDSVKRVNAGDLETKVPVQFHDEIGFLTDSFNTLTDSLRAEQIQRRRGATDYRALAQLLETRVANRTRELAALYDVSAIATRAQNQETLFHDSLARAMTALECPVGAILLATEKKKATEPTRWRIVTHFGLPPDAPVDREMIPAADGLFAMMSAQRQPVLIADVSADPRVPAAMHALGARALLLAPLLAEEHVFGVIGLLRDAQQGFSVEEITLLSIIAGQLSIGIQGQRVRQIATSRVGGGTPTPRARFARFGHAIALQRHPLRASHSQFGGFRKLAADATVCQPHQRNGATGAQRNALVDL
jgi:HAMP domain-containing protein